MCQHQPRCPQSRAPDHLAARIVAAHPEQGWSILCNDVRVHGTPTPPRIQTAARLPAQIADEFGAEQATPDQKLGS